MLAAALPGRADVITWKLDANGVWNLASNWDLGRVPGGLDDASNPFSDATITFNTGSYTVYSFTSAGPFSVSGGTLNGYSQNAASLVKVNNNFTLSGGGLNNLTVQPGSGGQGLLISGNNGQYLTNVILNCSLNAPSGSLLNLYSGTVLNGTAQMVNGTLQVYENGNNFTVGSSGLIHGWGSLSQYSNYNGNGYLTNNGNINADDPTGKPINSNIAHLVNSGVIKAEKGGNFYIVGGYLTGNNGVIGNADAGSFAGLNGGGATGTIIGNGINGLQVTNNPSNNFNGATLGGLVTLPNKSFVQANSNNTLTGTTLLAGGELKIGESGSVFTVGASGLIHGYGSLSQYSNYNGNGYLTNSGTINADVNGSAISSSVNTLTNAGTITAVNGGVFRVASGYLVGNASGVIGNADAGSFAELDGGGATGTIVGNGVNGLQVTGNGSNNFNNATLGGLITLPEKGFVRAYNANTLNGTFAFAGGDLEIGESGSAFTIGTNGLLKGFGAFSQYSNYNGNGSIINNGTITASGGQLLLTAGTLADGTGTVGNADDTSVFGLYGGSITGRVNGVGTKGLQCLNNRSNRFSGATLNGLVTFPAGGYVLATGGNTLNGTALLTGGDFEVYESNSVLTVSSGALIHGYGLLSQYSNYNGNGYLTSNGTINADVNGKSIASNISTLTDKSVITASNGGSFLITGGTVSGAGGTLGNSDDSSVAGLAGGTISGNLTGVGTKGIQCINYGGSGNRFNSATLSGLVTLPSGSYVLAVSNNTLNGTALLTDGNLQVYESGSVFTVGSSGLIHGYGSLSQYSNYNGNGFLTNSGTINADTNGGVIISSVNTLTNGGTITAANGGVFRVTSGYLVGNTGGVIGNADVSSFAGLDGGGATGTIIGNGVNGLQVTSNRSNNFSGATLGGLMTLPKSGFVRAYNANTLNGTFAFAGGDLEIGENSSVFTVGATGQIKGYGSFSQYSNYNGNGSIINNGAITASGGQLLLTQGTLAGGTGTVGNTDDTSVFGLAGGSITGPVNGVGTKGLQCFNNRNNRFSGAVLNGLVTFPANGYVLATGGNTLNGTALLTGGDFEVYESSSVLTVSSGALVHGYGSLSQYSNYNGTGYLTNNGTINADVSGQTLNIGVKYPTNHGLLTANGGTLAFSANIPSDGTVLVNSGSAISFAGLAQTKGITTDNGTISGNLTFNSGSNIPGEAGIINGVGTINGSVTNTNGVVIPGYNLGALTVTGTYTQGKYGQLKIALGGITPGTQYTQLNVGTASLDGTLVIQLINGYQPHLNDTFKIITHAARSGSFPNIVNVSPYGFEVVYNDKDVSLKVISGPETVGPLAWADNAFGEVGDGTTTQRNTPVAVSGLSGAVAAAGGGYHSLAIKADATVLAWGRNDSGQVGDGKTNTRTAPVPVSGLTGILVVAGGGYHSLALKNDGRVYAWGSNQFGQLGLGSSDASPHTAPVQVPGLTELSPLPPD